MQQHHSTPTGAQTAALRDELARRARRARLRAFAHDGDELPQLGATHAFAAELERLAEAAWGAAA